jgi:hypothetical protein
MEPAGARREDKWPIAACYEAMQLREKGFGSRGKTAMLLDFSAETPDVDFASAFARSKTKTVSIERRNTGRVLGEEGHSP